MRKDTEMGQKNRVLAKLLVVLFAAMLLLTAGAEGKVNSDRIEQWGLFELSLSGPSGGNPFEDVLLMGEFRQGERVFKPE